MPASAEMRRAEPADGEAVQELIRRAQEGDLSVLPLLRAWLDDNPDVWRRIGDLAGHAEEAVLGLIAGRDLLLKEAASGEGMAASRSITLPARIAAARPKTTRSISELDPSRLAPWTEAQPASPTAIKPGCTRFGSAAVGSSASPQ